MNEHSLYQLNRLQGQLSSSREKALEQREILILSVLEGTFPPLERDYPFLGSAEGCVVLNAELRERRLRMARVLEKCSLQARLFAARRRWVLYRGYVSLLLLVLLSGGAALLFGANPGQASHRTQSFPFLQSLPAQSPGAQHPGAQSPGPNLLGPISWAQSPGPNLLGPISWAQSPGPNLLDRDQCLEAKPANTLHPGKANPAPAGDRYQDVPPWRILT